MPPGDVLETDSIDDRDIEPLSRASYREWRLRGSLPWCRPGEEPSFPSVEKLVFFHRHRLDLARAASGRMFPSLRELFIQTGTWESNFDWNDLLAFLRDAGERVPLRRLHLAGFRTLAKHLPELLAANSIRGIESLDLGMSAVGEAGARALVEADPAKWPALRSLKISSAELGGAGAAVLAGLRFGLERLDVGNNRVGKKGLAGIAKIAGLTHLHLAFGGLKTADLGLLAKGPSASTLQVVDLSHNRNIDDGLVALLPSFPRLEQVEISNTGVSMETARELVERGLRLSSWSMPIEDMDLPSRTPAAPEGSVADTPEELEVALEGGDPGAILRLARKARLSLDAEYDVFGGAERTRPFHLIAGLGGTSGVAALVEKQARAVDERDSSRRTPLMFACCGPDLRPWDGEGRRAGSANTVKKLLALGADVQARDEQGQTALHHAAQVGAVACVKALLAAGADLATNQHGRTPLDFARQHGQAEVVALLQKRALS